MDSDIKKLGKYDIISVLGKGAMGIVYKGKDPFIERIVAIKTIRKDLETENAADELARFKREAQAAGRLNHPNIVGIYEYGEENNTAFIAMEFIQGRSLKDSLDAGERWEIPAIMGIMRQVLAALDYSHQHGVVHRDIKPANIMLMGDTAKVADFGIARIESSTMTQAGSVLGTPAYMSPEQFMGQTVDNRSDIYATGVMLYQLLTGEKPFTGSYATIMHRALNNMPDPPSALNVQVPKAFDKVVQKAVAKRPAERFQSAKEFLSTLEAAFQANDTEATPVVDNDATLTMLRPEPAKPVSKSPMLGVVGIAALATVGIGIWIAWDKANKPIPAASAPAAQTAQPPVTQPAAPPPAPKIGLSLTSNNGESPVFSYGEKLVVNVAVQGQAQLYCFYQDANKYTARIFPNRFQADNQLPAGGKLSIPADASQFSLVMDTSFAAVACLAGEDLKAKLPPALLDKDLEPLPAEFDAASIVSLGKSITGVEAALMPIGIMPKK